MRDNGRYVVGPSQIISNLRRESVIDGVINKDVRFVVIIHAQFCQLPAQIFYSTYDRCSDTVVFVKPRNRFIQKFVADSSVVFGFQ